MEKTGVISKGNRSILWTKPEYPLKETALPAGGNLCTLQRKPQYFLEETGVLVVRYRSTHWGKPEYPAEETGVVVGGNYRSRDRFLPPSLGQSTSQSPRSLATCLPGHLFPTRLSICQCLRNRSRRLNTVHTKWLSVRPSPASAAADGLRQGPASPPDGHLDIGAREWRTASQGGGLNRPAHGRPTDR